MLNDTERRIIDGVEEHGWYDMSVFGGSGPNFSYSIGFWETLKLPELIIFGLELKLMHSMLWSAYRHLKAGTCEMKDGARWLDILDNFECVPRPVHPTQVRFEHFNSAMWYKWHRGGNDASPLQAFQLFWPSAKSGLFPWEKDSGVAHLQPALYLPLEPGIA